MGRFEHFDEDLNFLCSQLNIPYNKTIHERNTSNYNYLKHLDPQAISNLRKWYKKDYNIKKEMQKYFDIPVLLENDVNNA